MTQVPGLPSMTQPQEPLAPPLTSDASVGGQLDFPPSVLNCVSHPWWPYPTFCHMTLTPIPLQGGFLGSLALGVCGLRLFPWKMLCVSQDWVIRGQTAPSLLLRALLSCLMAEATSPGGSPGWGVRLSLQW